MSGLCAGFISIAEVVISENPQFDWWVDGLVGTLLAVYTFGSGVYTIIQARRTLLEQLEEDSMGEHYKKLASQFHQQYSYQSGGFLQGTYEHLVHISFIT